jgi:hypothetical protein
MLNRRLGSTGCLLAALGIAAITTFAELLPGGWRPAALAPCLQLSLGAFCLALAGWSITELVGLRWALGNVALSIGIGQLAAMSWLYLRSVASALAEVLTGIALPVTRGEIVLLIAFLVGAAARKRGGCLGRLKASPSGALWIVVAILLIAQRELPREDMVSSDPLLHLFYTAQILRLGVVPFHLGTWGPNDFGYAAGYAALCAVWTWLGGGPPQNAVAGLPLLQSVLAVLALAALAARRVAPQDLRLAVVGGFLALLLFFGFFPFTLIKSVYLLEKTGSISTLLLLLTTVALSVFGGRGPPDRPQAAALVLAGAGVGLSAVVNPTAVFVPGAIYACAIGKRLFERQGPLRRRLGRALLLAAVPSMLAMTEPYYLLKLWLHRPSAPFDFEPPVAATAAGPTVWVEAGRYAADLLFTLQWTKPFLQTPYFGRTALSALPLLVAVPLIWRLLPQAQKGPILRWIVLLPVPVIALEFTLLPLFHALRARGDLFYLLGPYLWGAIVRFGYLWYMAVLLLALTLLLHRASSARAGLVLCVLGAALAAVPLHRARDSLTNEVRMKPRLDRCFYLGCITADDRVVLQALERRFADHVAAGGSLDFSVVPKILLPNAEHQFPGVWQEFPNDFIEKWIKPTGAAAFVPFVATFPAAFFYYRGSDDYANANYEAHVCRTLDIPWLRQRNIRYLFVPVHRNKACVAGLDSLLASEAVLVRSGDAALVQLY